eukprot:gnl/Dysnectes_brevis/1883_a2165_1626.p1 GENE.gnl/Dysnectes_brevis/1883_a2165_1626~~gnl/Dysnectes_brevis/1883_a2165_1626.p1  ORF type:complete len:504 (-),score=109.94 gnl/Dysnectes_brevis/1883_a2165_1626:115-1500(-)
MSKELTAALKSLSRGGYMSQSEVKGAMELITRASSSKDAPLVWSDVKNVPEDRLIDYSTLPSPSELHDVLSQIVILKLNGGLGTSMGCTCAKTLIPVKHGLSFLDIILRQVASLNATHGVDIPVVFMNSFNTDKDTKAAVTNSGIQGVNVFHFNQAMFPRLDPKTMLPNTATTPDQSAYWYPPGHGDVLRAFRDSGLVEQFAKQGKRWVFISNGDNLGATLDTTIASHLMDEGTDLQFMMEVTPKSMADVKGGTIVSYHGRVRLLECAQVPKEHVEDFKSVEKFSVFNTNNVWVNLTSLHEAGSIELDIIRNPKKIGAMPVLQLETAVGAAIGFFPRAAGVVVPRSRFVPVKRTGDLLLVQSDVFELGSDFRLNRVSGWLPRVRLSPAFKHLADYQARIPQPPSLKRCAELVVVGDVSIASDVSCVGNVQIIADRDGSLTVPSGASLENQILRGSMTIEGF